MTLEEAALECFGFAIDIKANFEGNTIGDIYLKYKEIESTDNILDLTVNYDEFVNKTNQK